MGSLNERKSRLMYGTYAVNWNKKAEHVYVESVISIDAMKNSIIFGKFPTCPESVRRAYKLPDYERKECVMTVHFPQSLPNLAILSVYLSEIRRSLMGYLSSFFCLIFGSVFFRVFLY